MSAEKAKQLFQSSQVAFKSGDLEVALDQAKRGLGVCEAGDGEMHAALLDLQASVETEIKKKERSKAEKRNLARTTREVAVKSPSAKTFAESHDKPSLRLHLRATTDNVGPHSKMGGCPATPKDFVWPKREDGRPLSFLCQINLAEVQNFGQVHKLLPKSGILSFYYDLEDKPSGLDAGDRHGWCVYYFPKQIKVNHFDEAEGQDIPGFKVQFVEEQSYPDPTSNETEELDRADYAEYDKFTDACYEQPPYHRLLGHSQLILGDFFEECEIASRGIDWQTARDDAYLVEEVQAASKKWLMLLQLDSDERVNFMWGDCGTIYFCIEEESLKHHDFSNVWLIMQCT
jgi:uncharacterized protein YwqG